MTTIEELKEAIADDETQNKTITIEVQSGMVTEVKNLPPGYDYELDDHDILDEEE